MTKDPYQIWNIDPNDYPKLGSINDKIIFLLRYAHLAPSAHNTQPWKFRVIKNSVEIFLNDEKLLLYADRTQREAFISIGCALANLMVAASHFNFTFDWVIQPEDNLEGAIVKIVLSKRKTSSNFKYTNLFPNITKRRTNRNSHFNRLIEKQIIHKAKTIAWDMGIEITVIKGVKRMKTLANIVGGATHFAFSDIVFKRELSEWVRSVYTKDGEGIALYDFGIPKPVTLFAPFLLRYMPPAIQSLQDRINIKNSASAIVITTEEDTKEYWIKAGVAFELMALYGVEAGIGFAPMGGIIEHDDSRKRLKKFIRTNNHPVFFARMGYSKKVTHHSPRRPLSDVLI
jgi:nitroreductase